MPPPQGLSRGKRFLSRTRTLMPRRASAEAAMAPAGPPPTTRTSALGVTLAGQPVLGHLSPLRPPDALVVLDEADELTETQEARRMPDHLGMAGEVEEPTPLVCAEELVAPDSVDHLRALQGPRHEGGMEEPVGRVVERPLHGQLDDRRARMDVWEDVVHEVAGVDHAVLAHQVEGDGGQIPGRRAVAGGLQAEHRVESLHAALEGPSLGLGVLRLRP